ncbi:MAG: YgjV family protein, partial [Patescibacteria group bacterium]
TILTWHGLISLLPMIGMITGTIAFWQSNPRYIRLIGLISPPLWFTYNYISGSYAGMFAEIILLSSNLIGIYRFDIKFKFSKIRL